MRETAKKLLISNARDFEVLNLEEFTTEKKGWIPKKERDGDGDICNRD